MHIPLIFLLFLLPLICAARDPVAVRDIPVSGEPRQQAVRLVVIHATGGPDCDPRRSFRGGSLDAITSHFLRNRERISIHYIVGREGSVVRMVPEATVAYHARGHNADSIGIELVNDGDGKDPFIDAQIASLIDLLRDIFTRHGLEFADVKSHSELDHSYLTCHGRPIKRKQDPGTMFPWDRLRKALAPGTTNLGRKLAPEPFNSNHQET